MDGFAYKMCVCVYACVCDDDENISKCAVKTKLTDVCKYMKMKKM